MGIGTNIQKILQNVSSMQRMITQIGTPQDNSQLQNQLHQIQHYTGQLAKDSSKQLKELNNYPPEEALDPRQWKLQRERLQADFTKALDNFQRAQRSAAQKEKDVIKKYRVSQPPGEDNNLIDIEGGQGQSKTQLMLEADIGDVNQIFKDLAAMVHDQGEMVDSIEANVESASIRVNEGSDQLRMAERYQNKARRKKMCLAGTGLIVLIILIGVIAHSVGN